MSIVTWGLGDSGGASGDVTAEGFSPAEGTPVNSTDAVEFDIMGADNIMVTLESQRTDAPEVVYDGTTFSAPYSARSTATAITGGVRFLLRRSPGWAGSFSFTAYPITPAS